MLSSQETGNNPVSTSTILLVRAFAGPVTAFNKLLDPLILPGAVLKKGQLIALGATIGERGLDIRDQQAIAIGLFARTQR